MPQGQLEGVTVEQQMDGVEAFLRLVVQTAVDGQRKFREEAGFEVRKLTDTADPGLPSNKTSVSAKITLLRADF